MTFLSAVSAGKFVFLLTGAYDQLGKRGVSLLFKRDLTGCDILGWSVD